jgi:hypothetical protein
VPQIVLKKILRQKTKYLKYPVVLLFTGPLVPQEKEGEEEDDAPLNLSIRSESMDSISGRTSLERRTPTSRSSSDYYACKDFARTTEGKN